jgi:ferredoxin-NADP reductase
VLGGAPAEAGIEARVASKVVLADGVAHLALRQSLGGEFPAWEPGAHVDLALDENLLRQYSLCGDPADREVLEVAVLREPRSRGASAYVHDKLREGDSLRVGGPRNHFRLVPAAEYLFIAGGIGITPILPMLRQVAESTAPWRLLYGGRSRFSMAFRDELVQRYGDRVSIRPQDETGLLDIAGELGATSDAAAVYCCGPEALLQAVERECQGRPPGSLHIERFAPKNQERPATEEPFEIELARTGATLFVPPSKTIVEVLREAGVDVPVSCLEGTCGTCETVVLAGAPDHRDSLLTEQERSRNDTMFLCVSRSLTPRLRIDR